MRHDNTSGPAPPSAELQLAGLIAKFEPKKQKLIKSVRRVLRKRFPAVNELVYDYTKSLVIGYSLNERGSDGIVAISADANGVRLFFNHGVSLPDPHRILLGDGRQTRYIRIEASTVLLRPEVESLLTAALSKVTIPIGRSDRGELIIKSSKKQTKRRDGARRGYGIAILRQMSGIDYRQAIKADIPSMAAIRAADWGTEQYWTERISGYLNRELHPHQALKPRMIYVASGNENLVGFIAGHLTRRHSCEGELEWINVVPDYRGRGIAAELLRRLAAWFSSQHVQRVCVDVDPTNLVARRFYRRYGARNMSQHWMVWDNIHPLPGTANNDDLQ